MRAFIDPARDRMLDPVALAKRLGSMGPDTLRSAEGLFRIGAEGHEISLDGREYVKFDNDMRMIPLAIAEIINKGRNDGRPLLPMLKRLARMIDRGVAATQIEELEALLALAPAETTRKDDDADEN